MPHCVSKANHMLHHIQTQNIIITVHPFINGHRPFHPRSYKTSRSSTHPKKSPPLFISQKTSVFCSLRLSLSSHSYPQTSLIFTPMSSPPPIPISSQQSAQSQPSRTIPIPSFRPILTRLSGLSRTALSNSRPWTELIDRTAFSRPSSLSDAASRVRKNAAYFRVNYLIVLATVLAYSLISHPFSLLTLLTLIGAWIFLYALRPADQPLVIFGRTFSDTQALFGLGLVTLIAILMTSVLSLLLTAATVGVAIVCAHGAFRDPEDLFLDEQQPLASGFTSIFGGAPSFASGSANRMSRV